MSKIDEIRVDKYPGYQDEIIINGGDKDLIPIKISVKDIYERTFRQYGYKPPPLPVVSTLDGYDLHIKDQKFRRIWTVPAKLTSLETTIRNKYKKLKRSKYKSISYIEDEIQNEFWETITKNQDNYKPEIEYIRRIWYYRLFGYWFMNNGIPTYMTGVNFVYLYFYHMKTSKSLSPLPDYRDRDRRWFLFQLFARLDTMDFVDKDKDGWAIPNEKGEYDMVDIGRRTLYGTITSKPRRVGDTSKSACDIIEEATRSLEGQFGNQAVDDQTSERIFLHYINTPYNKFPLFLKPLQEALNPKQKLVFDSDQVDFGLGSWIDFASTKEASAYDGTALRKYYGDEVGKVKNISVKTRHKTVKLCLSDRDVIHGNAIYTTTVEKMEGTAAEEFMRLSRDSMYHQRMDNGQTKSGLVVCFFAAYDGHPDFIDEYGMSVIETPTPEQARFLKRIYGAREYLERNRRLLKGEELALEKRQNPMTYRECFSPDPKNALFTNIETMQQRIVDLKFDTSNYRIGNFKWLEDRKFGRVEWYDDPDNGKFILSKHFDDKETNEVITIDEVKYPKNPNKYVGCGDTFRLEKTDSARMSKGGFAGFWLRDYDIDPEGTKVENMKSERFFIDYLEKPDSLNEYVEDLLMACIYCGMMMYPENNINTIAEKFIDWGYGGYLLYDIDPLTGRQKNNSGFFSGTGTKTEGFNLIREHFRHHSERCMHYRILEQAINLRGIEDIKNQDLFASALGAMLARKSKYGQYLSEDMNEDTDTSDWIPEYRY